MEFLNTFYKSPYHSLCLIVLFLISVNLNGQCASNNLIEDPEEFNWTYHPVSSSNPEAYYSGIMEVGEATFDFNGQTLTTRAYRQKGGAYSVPGPTLKMIPGNKYVLRLHNLLPYAPKEPTHNVFKDPNVVNLHTHGLHISGMSPGDDVTRSFEGGRGGDFVYDIPADHMGGTFWYHAHHHGATTLQVSGGMFGMIVIDDNNDGIPASVASMEEKLIMIGKIDPSVAGLGGDVLMGGTLSNTILTVNGHVGGEICMPPNTWQHWRVSIADPMAMLRDIEFGPECEVKVLARDGVWRTVAPKDLPSNSIQLTGASRADFAIRTTGNSTLKMNGMTVATITVNGSPDLGPHPFDSDGVSQWSANRPSYLRDLRNESIVNNESISMGARTVNGSKYNHHMPNLTLPTTDVQEWSLSGNVRHPFHLHVYHVQALVDDRDFEAGEYYDVVASQMNVRFDLNSANTTPFSGRTIMHCHILEHEDRGAMGWLNVIGGEGAPTFPIDSNLVEPFSDYYIIGGGTSNTPLEPSQLITTSVSSSEIVLTWDDNSFNEDGFSIHRSLDGINFDSISSVTSNISNYSDASLSSSTTYYYRVNAYNSSGNSGFSNVSNATTSSVSVGTSLIVGDIIVSRTQLNGNRFRGVADVLITDLNGNPANGVNVNGFFSGINSSSQNGITNNNGEVSFNAKAEKNPNGEWCFEVTNLNRSGDVYDPLYNVVTLACESGPVAKSLNNSNNKEISINDISTVKVYPNPTKNVITLEIKIDEIQGENIFYNLHDSRGNLVKKSSIELSTGINIITIDLNGFSNGVYILSFENTKDYFKEIRIIKF